MNQERTASCARVTDIADGLARSVSSETVIRRDEPLAKRTTLRVGGSADVLVEPASEEDLAAIVKFCAQQGLPLFILGRGSNLVVKDGGVRGVVVSLSHARFARIEVTGNRLSCGAGARLKSVAVEAKHRALAGFEFLEGIPGSVGGALRMNAGAMGGAMFDLVESVRLMDFTGHIEQRTSAELGVGYRCCQALKTNIALGAVLVGRPDDQRAIERRMKEFSQRRWDSQPAAPSAGCMFKNPLTIPAGKLIEELGLKGARVGGAMVSSEHGNFLVNDGTATAHDVLELIELIRDCARTKRAIELEPEVEIIGE